MTCVPFFDLERQQQLVRDDVERALLDVCGSTRFILGPAVEAFEQGFADFCQADHAIGVNSGTSALHAALAALDIGPGDEVITTPMTFVATAWAISYTGATPVFVDIDPVTRNLDPVELLAAITPRTKAIVPVHLYGLPADMDAIVQIAAAYGVPVVEDAAQAHGAECRGRRAGSLGQIGCFSFYPSKNLGAWGEAGAVVTSNEALAAKVQALRDHCQTIKNRHDGIGFNYRMDAMQGAVLEAKLKYVPRWNEARQQHARRYTQNLAGVTGVGLPAVPADYVHVWHLFVVEVDGRDQVAARLAERGIQTGMHYPIPVHLQPAYSHLGIGPGTFPVAERLAARCLSLPMFPELTAEEIDYVCEEVAEAITDTRRPTFAPTAKAA